MPLSFEISSRSYQNWAKGGCFVGYNDVNDDDDDHHKDHDNNDDYNDDDDDD